MLDAFDLLLLDLNGTFMFGQDRFGSHEDYPASYRAAGGSVLTPAEVSAAVEDLVARMSALQDRPDRYDSFPGVKAVLRALPACAGWPDSEIERMEHVVAVHELGSIPERHARVVAALANSHRLGLVSNLWSDKGPWLTELGRVGLLDVFDWLVFSSDGRSIKPSPLIYAPILGNWAGDGDRVLMIGDSLTRDVEGARAAGIKSLLVNADGVATPGSPVPDFRLADFLDLASPPVR